MVLNFAAKVGCKLVGGFVKAGGPNNRRSWSKGADHAIKKHGRYKYQINGDEVSW